MRFWKRLFGTNTEKPSVVKESIVGDLNVFWDSLGSDRAAAVKQHLVSLGAPCLTLLKGIAVDPTLPVNVRKSAIAVGAEFGDKEYASFLGREFVDGKSPGLLNAAYQKGDSRAGDDFALFREAKDWLEKLGYQISSREVSQGAPAESTSARLRSIDERFTKLSGSGDIDAAQTAINQGDGRSLYAVLSQRYGQLVELVCLSGPFRAKSILVFADGVGLLAGSGSYIPILTFGYVGQGSACLSALLSAAGFSSADASLFVPPLIVRRDGTAVKGVTTGNQIRWPDGSEMTIPKFPSD